MRIDYISTLFALIGYKPLVFMAASSFILSYFSSLAMSIPVITDLPHFEVHDEYDYSKSTEENYAMKGVVLYDEELKDDEDHTEIIRKSVRLSKNKHFVGKYENERKQMDYLYHKIYCHRRQVYQDHIIDRFLDTLILDSEHGVVCSIPEANWLVFTAGPMGAGKSFTMEWLHANGLFPLKAFVKVDPDMMRNLLPETRRYTEHNPDTAGKLTQKEVGYISEILTLYALKQGKNVLVDGSLRDAAWYLQYIQTLRQLYPDVKVAILHISASEATVVERAQKRAIETGRHVPLDVIRDTYHKINASMQILSPVTNFVASFENEKDSLEPRLIYTSGRDVVDFEAAAVVDTLDDEATCTLPNENWKDDFREVWRMTCRILP
jgi:predicted ABC-type ATPase